MYAELQTGLIFCTVFLLTWKFFQWKTLSSRNYPPGPFHWPIVGNLLEVIRSDTVCEAFFKYGQEYGPICMIKLGGQTCVLLSKFNVIKEALIDKANSFSERPLWLHNFKRMTDGKGIVGGYNWKNLRRFCLGALRDFGLGKTSLEEVIISECQVLVTQIEKYGKEPFNLKKTINVSVSNIICSIVFGKRFNYDDVEFKMLLEDFELVFGQLGARNAAGVLPWLRFIPLMSKSNEQVLTAKCRIDEYVKKRIQEHRLTFDADNIRDIIDVYIENEANHDQSHYITIEDLFHMIVDIFAAGTETTTTTLYWGVLFMVLNPKIQKRCANEIEAVVGRGRPPKFSDRGALPYTEATLLEIQRLGSIAPNALPHATLEGVNLGSYDIPKHTMVFPNLYYVHRDPTYWKDPEEFMPERWLDLENNIIQHTHFIPFSVGPRMCLGDNLAKMEMFLFFTSLLQHGVFTLPPSSEQPSLGATQGVTRSPQPFSVCYTVAE